MISCILYSRLTTILQGSASVDTSVLLLSLTRITCMSLCTTQQCYLAAGDSLVTLVPDIRRAPPRSPAPAALRGTWIPRALLRKSYPGTGAWLQLGWEILADCSWTVGRSKCSEHIRRGHSGPAPGTGLESWNCHFGHRCLSFRVRLPGS